MAGSCHSSIILACSFFYISMVFFMLTAFSCSSHFPIECLWIHRPDETLLSRISHLLLFWLDPDDLYLLFGDLLCCDSVHFRVRNDYACNYKVSQKDTEAQLFYMYIYKRKSTSYVLLLKVQFSSLMFTSSI